MKYFCFCAVIAILLTKIFSLKRFKDLNDVIFEFNKILISDDRKPTLYVRIQEEGMVLRSFRNFLNSDITGVFVQVEKIELNPSTKEKSIAVFYFSGGHPKPRNLSLNSEIIEAMRQYFDEGEEAKKIEYEEKKVEIQGRDGNFIPYTSGFTFSKPIQPIQPKHPIHPIQRMSSKSPYEAMNHRFNLPVRSKTFERPTLPENIEDPSVKNNAPPVRSMTLERPRLPENIQDPYVKGISSQPKITTEEHDIKFLRK
jgi:hypothetical protein